VFLFLTVLVCCQALSCLAARPLVITWGRSSYATDAVNVPGTARLVANLSTEIVDGVSGDPSAGVFLFHSSLFTRLWLLDKHGRVFPPPIAATERDYEPLRYFSYRALAGVITNEPFDSLTAIVADPVVKMAGPVVQFFLTNQGDVYSVNATYVIELLQNTTNPAILPPYGATKFIDIVSNDNSLGLISTAGDAYALSLMNEFCTVGTDLTRPGYQPRVFLPYGTNVTMMDLRAKHGLAVTTNATNGEETVWAWGAKCFFGIGVSDCNSCTIPMMIPGVDVLMSPLDRVRFLVASPVESHVVLASGRVISWGVDPAAFDVEIEGISVYAQLSIVQMTASYGGLHLLLSDGTVWSRMPPQGVIAAVNLFSALSDFSNRNNASVRALWKADFTPALPSNYAIRKLLTSAVNAGDLYAIADPLPAPIVVSEPLLNPPDPYETSPTTNRLITWGTCPFSPFSTNSEIAPLLTNFISQDYLMDLTHLPNLPPQARQVVKVSVDYMHALILTASGHVLSWGAANSQSATTGVSPYQSGVSWRLPKVIDPALFGGQAVVDVAAGTGNSAVLLANGSIVLWGSYATPINQYKRDVSLNNKDSDVHSKEFETLCQISGTLPYTSIFLAPHHQQQQHPRYRHQKTQQSQGSKRSSYEELLSFPDEHLNSLAFLSTYTGSFTNLQAQGPVITAFDTVNQVPVSIVPSSSAPSVPSPLISHPSLLTPPETALIITPANAAFVVLSSSFRLTYVTYGTNTTIGQCDSSIEVPVGGFIAFYCVISTPLLNTSTILQIETGDAFLMFRAVDGVYGVGTNPYLWSGTLTTPSPLNFLGVDPLLLKSTNLAKITTAGQHTYFLLKNGTLLATCGDVNTLCISLPGAVPILRTSYSFIDIIGTRSSGADCMMAIVNLPGSPSFSHVIPEPAFKPLFLGDAFSGSSGFGYYGISAKMTTMGLAPPGHPLESPSATNISLGVFLNFVDGMRDDAPAYPRWIRSGSQTTMSTTDTGNTPTFWDLNVTVPTTVTSAGWAHVVLRAGCTLELWESNPGSTTSFPLQPNYTSQFPSDTPPRVYTDTAVGWITSTVTQNPQCQTRQSTVVDFQCHSKSPTQNDPLFCLLWTADGHLYTYGMSSYADPKKLACQYGVLGDIVTCSANYVDQFTLDVDVSTTKSALAGRVVTQVSLGARHVLVLTASGEVVCWGDPTYGQCPFPLGMIPVYPTLVSLPTTSITRVVASSWTSYAVVNDLYIYAWGDNKFGGLGTGVGSLLLPFSSTPVIVRTPVRPISQFKCSAYTCYVLFQNGQLYTWGLGDMDNLGRPTPPSNPIESNIARFDPMPAVAATAIALFGPTRRITEIHTSSAAFAAILRAVYDTSAPPVTVACYGPPPSPAFDCVDGTWIAVGPIVFGPSVNNSQVVIGSPTVVIGNLTIEPGSTIVFSNPLPSGSLLNVSGCITGSPSIQITFDPSTWKTTKSGNPNGKQYTLLESSSCPSTTSVSDLANPRVTTPKDCRKTSATLQDGTSTSGRPTLLAIMHVNSSKCNVWWIVLLSVFGAALVVVVIGAVIWKTMRNRMMKAGVN